MEDEELELIRKTVLDNIAYHVKRSKEGLAEDTSFLLVHSYLLIKILDRLESIDKELVSMNPAYKS